MSSTSGIEITETPAIRMLDQFGVSYKKHVFGYEEKGGTKNSSEKLGVSEHAIIKTLVFKTDLGVPLIVLMHGDRQVDTKALAKQIGAKRISSATPEFANEKTGYIVGGISPFGLKEKIEVHIESSILDLSLIFINGGGRGFLVSLDPKELLRLLAPKSVQVAIAHKDRK